MFVDDNVDFIDVYCLLVEFMGVIVLGIIFLKKVVDVFKIFKFYFVFFDIGMLDIDGY